MNSEILSFLASTLMLGILFYLSRNNKKLMNWSKVILILGFAAMLSYVNFTRDLKLGLDLSGGTQLDYSIDLSKVDSADKDQIVEGVKEVINKRVNSLGVSEPNIYTSNVGDEYHIIVELAGISDIEQAKAIVGKTIQLEFKEQEDNPDNSKQVAWATEESQKFADAIKAGEDFATLADKTQKADPENVQYTPYTDEALTNLSQDIQDKIKGTKDGDLIGPMNLKTGYVVDATGNVTEGNAQGFIQVLNHSSEEQDKEVEEKISARHILIAWEGSSAGESVTRTKEEAYTLIQEIQQKLADGADFQELAKEYSDDTGTKENGGDLGSFGKGKMVAAFEDAAFALEKDQVSEVVETEFGYHLIQVYDKQAASTETETVQKASLNLILWSTQASPWKAEAALTGEHFKHADVQFNQAYQPFVSITFDEEGGKIFEELTGNNINKRIAIFVGGEVISAPNVQSKISGGTAQITGNFTLEEAQGLARDLNTGAIPAPVELVGQHNISATLGQEALDQSLFAGFIGVFVLALFMVLYYRLPGLLAVLALGVYSLMIIFVVKTGLPTALALLISLAVCSYAIHLILKNKDSGGEKFIAFLVTCFVLFFLTLVLASQITLTLAGIAGVVLSIGMAVDANVLIFERMKEELRDGRNLHQAIEEGFKRAWDSIRDSNFSSLITCAILFYFGSSLIRGFATNLALGILISMFSAIMLTRTLLNVTAETSLSKKLWLWGHASKETSHWNIMKQSRIWAGISASLALVSVGAIAFFGLRLGLDFTGGTLMEIKLNNEALTTESIQADVTSVATELKIDLGSPQVVSTQEGTFIIRIKHVDEATHNVLLAKLKEASPALEELRFTTVGPTIGASLKHKALTALLVTSLMIVLYIAFAFRRVPKEVSTWRFGISAMLALLHDVLMVIGVFALLGHYYHVEIDALFITALLTVMGFSVHDTIVVFDRIRENLKFRAEGETLRETTNKALNQTLARSINTSLATLITIVALLIFGAESIRMFVLALTVGITAGTYSSIFIASPLMVWWTEWSAKRN